MNSASVLGRIARAWFGLSLFLVGCGASDGSETPPVLDSAPLQQSVRPASVPTDYVATPHGYFHPSCVVTLAADEQIAPGSAGILRRNGQRRALSPCGHPRFNRSGAVVRPEQAAPSALEQAPQAAPAVPAAPYDGWIISARNASTGPVRSLSGRFSVPPAPTVVSGQIVYLFPGLVPLATNNTILQPVLGWNHIGDGPRWTMASWNCCVEGNVVHSALIPVSPGHVLDGSMVGSDCNTATGICANWQVNTRNVTTNESTLLQTTSYNQVIDWLFGGVLEVYGLSECGQLPPSNGIQFSNLKAEVVGGGQVPVSWYTDLTPGDFPSCNYSVDSTSSTVQVNWGAPSGPPTPLPRTGWIASASSTAGADVPARALDGNLATRFSSGVPQSNLTTQSFTVDMLSVRNFSQIIIDSPGNDYARSVQVYASNDGASWGAALATVSAFSSVTTIDVPPTNARYLQLRTIPASGVGSWWSIRELNVLGTVTAPSGQALPRAGWVVSASATGGADVASRAIDANAGTRWSSGSPQSNATARSFTVDLQSAQTFAKLTLESGGDYARSYQVYASTDGVSWGTAIASGAGSGATTTITFPQKTARYVQIRQSTAAGIGAWWSIYELNLFSP